MSKPIEKRRVNKGGVLHEQTWQLVSETRVSTDVEAASVLRRVIARFVDDLFTTPGMRDDALGELCSIAASELRGAGLLKEDTSGV